MNVSTETVSFKRESRISPQYHYVLADETSLHSDDDSESVHSFQDKETVSARDTSDTETYLSDDNNTEYEAVSDTEDETGVRVIHSLTDTDSDGDIITTKVIEVAVLDEADLMLADSEDSLSAPTDPELEKTDYWQCAQCRNANNNPLYRYCEKCFKVRKNFFPPRPKRKNKSKIDPPNHAKDDSLTTLKERLDPSTDSAFSSQELSENNNQSIQDIKFEDIKVINVPVKLKQNLEVGNSSKNILVDKTIYLPRKRKRLEYLSSSDSEFEEIVPKHLKTKNFTEIITKDEFVSPVMTSVSDPSINVKSLDNLNSSTSTESLVDKGESNNISSRVVMKSLKEKLENNEDSNQCIVCLSEPKSGVFVHGKIAHICCCYKCSLKIWATVKRCPVCNRKVSNVLRAIVM